MSAGMDPIGEAVLMEDEEARAQVVNILAERESACVLFGDYTGVDAVRN
jgi:hypothetical protein